MSMPFDSHEFSGQWNEVVERLGVQERRRPRAAAPAFELPGRLGPLGQLVGNANDAIEDGFYTMASNAANTPVARVTSLRVYRTSATRRVQEVRCAEAGILGRGLWQRFTTNDGTTWSPWRQLVALSGEATIAGSGGEPSGLVAVTLTPGFFTDAPDVNVGSITRSTGAAVIASATLVTATGFTVRAVAASAAPFSNTYAFPYIATEKL